MAALETYKELYKFTPPNWGKSFFLENNQAITEGLAAMSLNFFAIAPFHLRTPQMVRTASSRNSEF